MLMEARPAMEEKQATVVIVRLRIRHSMRVVCLQTCDICMLESRRNKSHSHIRPCGLRASENIARPCFIEWPNYNLPIPSDFFCFFHRGPSIQGHVDDGWKDQEERTPLHIAAMYV